MLSLFERKVCAKTALEGPKSIKNGDNGINGENGVSSNGENGIYKRVSRTV